MNAVIRVMNEASVERPAIVQSLPQRVEHEASIRYPLNLIAEPSVASGARRQASRIALAPDIFVPGRRGDLQHPAHRLGPEILHMRFHERNYFLCRRSSSAAAK